MADSNTSKFVKVRSEEIAIGALVGVATGLAAMAPFTLGLPSVNPLAAGIGVTSALQAVAFWGGVLGGGGLGGWWAARQERDSHVSGHRYLRDAAEAQAALQAPQTEAYREPQRRGDVAGVRIGGVELSRAQEVRHIVAIGTTGAGKTAVLNSLIEPALARGDRLLIHDPKGDYSARYYDPETVVLLGPWDARAAMWDIAEDVSTPALADEFAATTIGRVQGENKSFYDGASTLLSGLIQSFMLVGGGWTWRQLADALAEAPEAIAARAATAVPDVRSAVPTAFRSDDGGLSNGDASKFSILSSGTRWVKNYAAVERAEARRFSVTRWLLADDPRTRMVMMNNNAQYASAATAIFGGILNAAAAVVNSAAMPETSPDASGVWCILDELPQVGESALTALQKISELGRSRGLRAVLAMQDESQLAALVGKDKAAPMLAVQGARIYMQVSPETADAVSRRVGEREINRIETTSANGALSGKQKKLVTQRVLPPSELTGLRPRIAQAPLGVELVLHIGETLGRLIQPFPPPRPDAAPPLVESDAWKFGTLRAAQVEAVAAEETAPEATAEPGAPPPAALNPFDFDVED